MYNYNNRGEQINETLGFIINDTEHYIALKHTPGRLKVACEEIVVNRMHTGGYHCQVVRRALRELNSTGVIDYAGPIYSTEDLYS